MEANIFLVIELYLAKPTTVLAEKIKEISTSLRNEAYKLAYQEGFESRTRQNLLFNENSSANLIKIGADEFQPKLMELIAKQAAEAFPNSIRLIKNKQEVTRTDPAYIFMLSAR